MDGGSTFFNLNVISGQILQIFEQQNWPISMLFSGKPTYF